jgi:hypothetical protein
LGQIVGRCKSKKIIIIVNKVSFLHVEFSLNFAFGIMSNQKPN